MSNGTSRQKALNAIAEARTADDYEFGTQSPVLDLQEAQVYALLDIADAIREHTATTHPAGKDHS